MPFPEYTETVNLYTTRAEIERLLSYKGVSLHLDDTDDLDDNYGGGTSTLVTPSNTLDEIIERATSRVNEYLLPRYAPATLSLLPRVREITTFIACHLLSRRRGNEPLYDDEVAESIETLERYREGSLYINAPLQGPRAVTQSFVTDNRYFRNPVRVLTHSSTDTVANQNLAWDYPFFWL